MHLYIWSLSILWILLTVHLGVSLRILSMDSDGFQGSAWASAMEWDYYDPSYVTQNHIPKHRPHAPSITTKQYWV